MFVPGRRQKRRTGGHEQRSEHEQRFSAEAVAKESGRDVERQSSQREGGAREAHPRRAGAEALRNHTPRVDKVTALLVDKGRASAGPSTRQSAALNQIRELR